MAESGVDAAVLRGSAECCANSRGAVTTMRKSARSGRRMEDLTVDVDPYHATSPAIQVNGRALLLC